MSFVQLTAYHISRYHALHFLILAIIEYQKWFFKYKNM